MNTHLVWKQLEWRASLPLLSPFLASYSPCLSAKITLGMSCVSHGCFDSLPCSRQDPGRLILCWGRRRAPTSFSTTHPGKALLMPHGSPKEPVGFGLS